MEVFKDYAYYYNSFYQDKDYGVEAAQIDSLLKKYGRDVHSVINFGCGTGKHDLKLARMGYQCAGVDASRLMASIAKENAEREGVSIDFTVADIRRFEPDRKYSAVISLFHVMSYQNTNEDILSAFQSARKALKPGGIFLFDVWYGPGVLSDKPAVRVKEAEDEKNRLVRVARPVMDDKKNMVDVCYEVFVMNKANGKTRVINEVHHMRYFFRPEIEFLLKQAGFVLEDSLDCQTLGETDFDSWTCYFVAKAQ